MGVDAQMDLDPAGWIYIYIQFGIWNGFSKDIGRLCNRSSRIWSRIVRAKLFAQLEIPSPVMKHPSRNHGWFKDYPQMTTIQQGFRLFMDGMISPTRCLPRERRILPVVVIGSRTFRGTRGTFFFVTESPLSFLTVQDIEGRWVRSALEAEPIDERKRFNGWSITGC